MQKNENNYVRGIELFFCKSSILFYACFATICNIRKWVCAANGRCLEFLSNFSVYLIILFVYKI